MTTQAQQAAEAAYAPSAAQKLTQAQKIVRYLNRYGFIQQAAAWYDMSLHISKLSTRIGEIERATGVTFKREAGANGFKRYSVKPEQLAELNSYYFKIKNS